jgi:undecaprenyl-diphosphatase
MIEYLTALFLGFVEGLTEFVPVSSTGHLILLIEGFKIPTPPGHVFEVFIQLGAILAVMVLYRQKIFHTISGLSSDPVAQNFARNIIIATIPAVLIGAPLHSFIKGTLYDPIIIASMLILGGIFILLFEKNFTAPSVHTIDDISLKQAFLIGCCQSVALVPGVSRSGATIMGSLAMGLSRTTAAEFSFFMAMPVMVAAVTYDIYKNWESLVTYPHMGMMLAGFVASFVTALLIVKAAIRFIGRYGFAPFAWYRIVIGLITLVIFL